MELSASLGEEPVTSLDRYLGQVSRHLMGLSPKLRGDVLMELRSHILSQSEAEGAGVDAVIDKMGSPKDTARSYVQLYGYGIGMTTLVAVVSAVVAFLSLPFSLGPSTILGRPEVANTTLILLILFLIIVGAKMGGRTGLVAGGLASVVRFGALGIAYVQEVPSLVTEPVAILAFGVTTVALAFVGYLAAPRQTPAPE